MIESGKLPVAKLIDAVIPLNNLVEEGFKSLLDPAETKMKVLVDVGAD
jgi:(R,R)-butanediol dehydrogenase/meso-butanediol dehydrogenase/diacetyl reductase